MMCLKMYKKCKSFFTNDAIYLEKNMCNYLIICIKGNWIHLKINLKSAESYLIMIYSMVVRGILFKKAKQYW